MPIQTNDKGKATGKFKVPQVPTGTKLVQFIGDQGNFGEATFTGRGTVRTEERRRVTTLTDIRRNETTVVMRRFDPLAQTFTLEEGRHIGGIDLWFDMIGTKRVVVQIRTTQIGMPTQEVLAQGAIEAKNIKAEGHTRITWQPVYLEPGTEYAVVLMTDDAETSVKIAELGKYDTKNKKWITAQPYHIGVLLSSSNAVTWTPHQDKDLAFRLLAAKFTETTKTVDLGEVEVDQLSDLIALANIERITANTDCVFLITDKDGQEFRLTEDFPLQLQKRVGGKMRLKAILTGTTLHSPVLYPGIQMVLGSVSNEADYITRSIPAGKNTRVSITYEAHLTGPADVLAYIKVDKTWQKVDLQNTLPIVDQWIERTHILKHFNKDQAQVKLVLKGNDQSRPRVRNLRIVVT